MKAIGRATLSLVFLAVSGTMITSCSERVIPPPAPAPRPSQPAPPPVVQREVLDWRDAPITPGDWTWATEGAESVARFAGGILELRCPAGAGAVSLRRTGNGAAGAVPITIATSSITRTITGAATASTPGIVTASIPAQDGLLDAMAFSRGRFAVDTPGMATLYVPSWPEVSRLVEDCRG